MSFEKAKQSMKNLGAALQRLEEALREDETNSLVVDGTIQRYEFVMELYWKTLKRLLSLEGIDVTTPKETLKKAYKVKWIDDEVVWLAMLNDRNMTSHLYDESMARKIYTHIKRNFPVLNETYQSLQKRCKFP